MHLTFFPICVKIVRHFLVPKTGSFGRPDHHARAEEGIEKTFREATSGTNDRESSDAGLPESIPAENIRHFRQTNHTSERTKDVFGEFRSIRLLYTFVLEHEIHSWELDLSNPGHLRHLPFFYSNFGFCTVESFPGKSIRSKNSYFLSWKQTRKSRMCVRGLSLCR